MNCELFTVQVYRTSYLSRGFAYATQLLVHGVIYPNKVNMIEFFRLAGVAVHSPVYVERASVGVAVRVVVSIAVAEGIKYPRAVA